MLCIYSTSQGRNCQDFRSTEISSYQPEKSARITPSAFSCSHCINVKLHVSIHRTNVLNGRMPDSKCYAYIVPIAGSVVMRFTPPALVTSGANYPLNQFPTVPIIPFFSVNCYDVVSEELLEPFVVCLRAFAPKILFFQPTPQRGNGWESHFGSLCHCALSFSGGTAPGRCYLKLIGLQKIICRFNGIFFLCIDPPCCQINISQAAPFVIVDVYPFHVATLPE